MKTKAVLFLLVLLFLGSFATADDTFFEIPPLKQNTCGQLVQTCANCTFVNVTSVQFPNRTIQYLVKTMSKNATTYNLTFCNTNSLGAYIYDTVGDPDGIAAQESVQFKVTRTGDEIQTSSSIIYIFALTLGLFLFCLFLYGSIVIPSVNNKNEEDVLQSVNWLKYMKYLFFVLTYTSFLWITYMVYNITLGYTSFEGTAQYFFYIHRVFAVMLRPVLIVMVIFVIVRAARDFNLEKLLAKGYKIK